MASDSDEAMTTDELQDPSSSSATTTTPAAPAKATPQRNAFTALMAPKPSSSSSSSSSSAAAAAATLATTSRSHAGGKTTTTSSHGSGPSGSAFGLAAAAAKNRMGLGAYIRDPGAFPPSVIIYQNANFVAIHDKFPKATVHALLLPRSSAHSLLHPFDAFRDAAFLESVRHEVRRLRGLVARELQRRLGVHSRAERRRQAVLNGDEVEAPTSRDSAGRGGGKSKKDDDDDGDGAVPLPPPLLPPGRDWDKEVICGVHAVPSMSHLHVHVLSRDMHSGTMRHRSHYNSFTTPFLVDLDAFSPKPGEHQVEDGGGGGGGGGWLEEEDPRRQGHLRRDLRCWRCGKGFGNQFRKLKDHLEEEFVSWRSE
ncbi:aprataxin-like protein [Moelleriella libera RCEF 2490]|uniref:Aprataxin-like protein n=1 Tax=Moelleriella libera RCEF 2490 TaxID=1081109 RepID=A0A168D8E1_9HYPO|nr:aprataxin-like protein [Moelleriella libera RCEF 2490]